MRAGAAVSIDAWCIALGCTLLLACASQAPAAHTERAVADMLYDPASEWQRDRPQRAPRPAPRRRQLVAEPIDPAFELPAFSASARERIAYVQPIVEQVARARSVPPDLINGIIWVESRFQVRALGTKGPSGLMQIMPATGREIARDLGLRYHPYDPHFNIEAGTYYFVRMVERFGGNLRLALAAYNIGPATVEGWLRDNRPLPGHSRLYVDNVFAAARAFRDRGAPAAIARTESAP